MEMIRTKCAARLFAALALVAVACGVAPRAASEQAPVASSGQASSPTAALSPSATPLVSVVAETAKPTATVAATPVANAPATPAPSAARSATLNARTYRIADAYLWRDFMPISEPGGRPLAASIKIEVDTGAFPSDVTVDHLWVYGTAAWEPATFEVRRSPDAGTPASQIEVFANGGPKWDPGSEVNVDVRIVAGGTTRILRITGVTIQKTS
jgi:hypothetical protein